MSEKRIGDLFKIGNRFLRSAHLERDFEDPSVLSGYVVTDFTRSCLGRVSNGLKPRSGQRAWRMTGDQCPFCSPASEDILLCNPLCYARCDRYPVTKGHILIIPFRHFANFLTLTDDERNAALELVWQASQKLDSEFCPDGYNVGVNVGQAAGQTVMHAHLHLIPRYLGDVPDPRGGVRFVIPDKARYWQDAGEGTKVAK